ncbi:MAG: tetratricopeptide repeat protein [Akkermansia sp.]
MKLNPTLSLLLLVPSVTLVSAQTEQGFLHANQERDSLAIAEQLYNQALDASTTPQDKAMILSRAAQLFSTFSKKYPRSTYLPRALYLQAACVMESGNIAQANQLLANLANTTQGEYAAAAAYKLGTQAAANQSWDVAAGYFQIVVQQTQRAQLGNDARFRLAKSLQQQNKLQEAMPIYEHLIGMPNLDANLLSSAIFSLAQLKTQLNLNEDAYALFVRLLQMPNLPSSLLGNATLQAARLATILGKSAEAKSHYASLSTIQGMDIYRGEAQFEQIATLYRNKDYKQLVSLVAGGLAPIADPAQVAARDLIIGQALLELKHFDEAAYYFETAEKAAPDPARAAEAGYRRIVAAQLAKNGQVFALAENYLKNYTNRPETAQNALNDVVRFLYADHLMASNVDEAARQFAALNLDNLPQDIRPNAQFHQAWCASKATNGGGMDPVTILKQFIESYPEHEKLPNALVLRAACLIKIGKLNEGLKDYDEVIKRFPDSDFAALSWQAAAQACSDAKRDSQMISYYQGLIQNCPKVKSSALAEAHFNLARAFYQDKPEESIAHFIEARRLDEKRYKSTVDFNLVQCYFKLQQHAELEAALEELKKSNAKAYGDLPAAIFRWCGWMNYQNKEYLKANSYLTASLQQEKETESYTAPDGQVLQRPKVEPIVWKTLARTRLELGLYKDGLDPARHYVEMESLPYRKAEGMRDEAQILIGLKRSDEAIALAEQAIEMGVDGPLKSSIFLTLGDACYAKYDFTEAAKYYGRTANIVSDKNMKPIALYKIAVALKEAGKNGEAEIYRQSLKKEFPDWTPTGKLSKFMLDIAAEAKDAAKVAAPLEPAEPVPAS